MKVTFKFGIGSYSGTVDGMVYTPTRNKMGSIARLYVIPQHTTNNTLRGAIMKNLADVWGSISSSYKDDMMSYCQKWNNVYNDLQDTFSPRRSSFAMFVDMMYLFSELDSGHVDLATVTYTDLQTVGADIASIAVAVTNGYLQSVPGADAYTATL